MIDDKKKWIKLLKNLKKTIFFFSGMISAEKDDDWWCKVKWEKSEK